MWVVADDFRREMWPEDAPVYRRFEVKILSDVGRNTLAWMHPSP